MTTAVAVPTALFVLAAFLMAIPAGTTAGLGLAPAGAQIAAFDPRQLDPEPLFAAWGVTGAAPNVHATQNGCLGAECQPGMWTGPQPNVWDFAEIGDRVYVAGIFTGVRRNEFYWPNDPVRDQPFLAAFDRVTGEFLASFAPKLNGPVYEIVALPDGKLLAGGEFTQVNGVPRVGLVALDAATGSTVAGFRATLAAPGSPEPAYVKRLLVDGSSVYVAGAFSRLRDGADNFVWNVVRLNAATGVLDRSWIPRAAGSVWDLTLDPGRGRIHLAGYFTSVDALPATNRLASVRTTDGRAIGGLVQYAFNHDWNNDTIGVTSAANRTWVVGGNHLLGLLDPTTNARLRTYDDTAWPGRAGDLQTVESVGSFVLAGHHGTGGGTLWAFDATTTNLVNWAPNLSRNVYGTWALHVDAEGCLWAGGDHHRTTSGRWLGGFARFCPRSSNLASAKVATQSSTFGLGVAQRAVDGNIDGVYANGSVSHTFGGEAQPWWQVDLGSSRSVGSVELFNRTDCCTDRLSKVWLLASDAPITGATLDIARTQPGVRATNLGGPLGLLGTSRRLDVSARYVRIQLEGSDHLSLAEVRIWQGRPADTNAPTTPTLPTAVPDATGVSLSWEAATDDVGIRGYLIHRNWQFIAWVPVGTRYRDDTATAGQSYRYEIRAQDSAGNNSPASTPVTVRAGQPDTERPTTPTGLAMTATGTSVTLTWTPATDNIGVRGYLVHRDWKFLAWVPTGTTFTDGNLIAGQRYEYQVRAQDSAGNNSEPTAATPVVLP